MLINATLEDLLSISTIDNPACSNLPYDCPSQPYSLTSIKQNYVDLCAQSVDVKEFLFRKMYSLINKVTSYEQQMDHIMINFGNFTYKTELELNVPLLEKENFEPRGQLIGNMLIIKQLKTDSKSYPLTTDASATTNTINTPAQTYDNININNDNNCKNKNKDNNNNKNNKIGNAKKNNNSTNKNAVYNEKLKAQLQEIRKEKYINYLNLKTYEEQTDQNDLSQRNKSNKCINSTQINRNVTDAKWPEGTVAIVGDSIMSGIRVELLKADKHNVKVRFFRDMEDNIKTILKREPDYIILYVGRRSDNGKAALTNHHFCNFLEKLKTDIFKNRNIGSKHLGGKGLYLNPHGTARLALNLKATLRKLRSKFVNLGNPGYQSKIASVSSDHNNFEKLNHCDKNQPEKSTFSFQELNDKATEVMLLTFYEPNPNRIMIGQKQI